MVTDANKGIEIEPPSTQNSLRLNRWLERLLTEGGSDLLLVPQGAAAMRIEGELQAIDNEPLTP